MSKPYHWFQGSSVRELFDRLQAAGPDTCRLEVRQRQKHMTFHVISEGPSTQSHVGGVNASHICPPDCPPPGGG